jgi:hypothetical protein
MARKHKQDVVSWYQQPEPDICPLCNRLIPADQRDEHHLIPKSRGGRQTQALHRICHRQIHALFDEAELEKSYSTVEALLEHPQMDRFVKWVRKKPPGFYDGTRRSNRRKEKG